MIIKLDKQTSLPSSKNAMLLLFPLQVDLALWGLPAFGHLQSAIL